MIYWRAKGLTHGHQKRGTKPLAAGEDAPANCGMNPLRRCGFLGNETLEFGLD
jgi:hypothetical protein